tara:strand:- start:2572 stop:2724 length:153 start_codon:yes stop_codon:yes gene_type:complete
VGINEIITFIEEGLPATMAWVFSRLFLLKLSLNPLLNQNLGWDLVGVNLN